MKLTRLILLIFIFLPIFIFGQPEADSTDLTKVRVFGYPYAFYTPETQLAFGLGGMLYFRTIRDSSIELSNIILSGYYTLNSQYKFTLSPELYLSKTGDYFQGSFVYGRFLDKFYGFGSQSPEIDNPDYLTQEFNAFLYFRKNLNKNLKVGIIYDYFNTTVVDKKENPYLLSNAVVGSDGGVSSGIGLSTTWDSRDFVYISTRGWYYYIGATFYSKAFGSDYDFNEFVFDLREFYRPFGKHVFAFQTFASFARGNPPFYEVPRLGGDITMRGYYEGRYRDRNYLTVQMEYKTIAYWRIGLVIFGGMGDVAADFDEFKMTNIKFSYGFGFRYVFDAKERLTIRADFGFGKNTSGVYFSMQEAF